MTKLDKPEQKLTKCRQQKPKNSDREQ